LFDRLLLLRHLSVGLAQFQPIRMSPQFQPFL
jgi:hypothetical protein